MSETLVALLAQQNDLVNELIASEGEISEELEIKMKSLPEKVDSCQFVLSRFEMEQNYFAERAAYFADISKRFGKARDQITEYIKYSMESAGQTEVNGNDYTIKLRNNPPSVNIIDEALIPAGYMNEKVTKVVDKKRIKEDALIGVVVPGAEIKIGTSIKFTANKKGLK